MPPAEPIWLLGLTGVGKSTVGRALAARLGRAFADLDDEIAREAGASIAELFAREGEAGFRRREAAAVARAAAGDAVVAAGGGAPCFGANLEVMQRSGPTVWLRDGLDAILARVDVASRPLLAAAPDPRARLAELLAARAPVYRRADHWIERRGRAPDALAAAVDAALQQEAPCYDCDERPPLAPIYFAALPAAERFFVARLARVAPPARAAVGLVTDETVGRLHLPRYRAALQQAGYRLREVVVPDGEAAKTMQRAAEVADAFARDLDRRSTVVALGGGAVGDLAGFVASILFRGVAFVQAPTTLLAQVDASVGGKTGVNLPSGKNLVGTFHQPRFTFADLSALATLDARDVASGLAELAKHALLDGGALLARLEAEAERARAADPALLAELVAASCAIKERVVAADEREQDPAGGRLLLNLGHTVGHALESDSHRRPRHPQDPLRHGEAVALGLVAAARVSRALAGAPAALEACVASLLARLGLPVDLDRRLTADALAAIAVDKKRAGADVRFVALQQPGAPRVVAVAPARLAELLSTAADRSYDPQRRSP